MNTPYRAEIELAAKARGVDPDLLDALVSKESSYNVRAYRFEPAFFERYLKGKPGYVGMPPEQVERVSASYGLTQTMYVVAQEHGLTAEPEYLFLVGVNLDMGAKVLAGWLAKYPTPAIALACYNGGSGGIGKPVPSAYAADVLKRYAAIRAARGIAA